MPFEIEKKFLVTDDQYKKDAEKQIKTWSLRNNI